MNDYEGWPENSNEFHHFARRGEHCRNLCLGLFPVYEKHVADLVVNTFGMYGGKTLEKITHNEEPWREARRGYGDGIPSSELLSKERIMKYYTAVNQKYRIDTEDGLKTYIRDMLDKAS